MEPALTATIPVDTEFIFKKAALEALKNSNNGKLKSETFVVCKFSNVKHFVTIFPNGSDAEDRGMVFTCLVVEIGKAKIVEADVNYTIKSAKFSKDVKHVYKTSEGYGKYICAIDKFFDPASKIFTDDVLTISLKGVYKILLPPVIKYPISAQWVIKESELEALKTSENGCLRSKRFSISSDSELKYFLKFCPNEDKEEDRGTAWIYFYLTNGSGKLVDAVFNFSINSAKFSSDLRYLFSKSEKCGNVCCSTSDLFNLDKRYFVDGELTLKVSGTLMTENDLSEYTILKCEKGMEIKACVEHLNPDFHIFVGDKRIDAHEIVLAEASPVFAAMFNSRMKENIERKMVIPDFTYDVVKAAIRHLYNFPLCQKFTFEDMKSLLRFSDKYDIKLLKYTVQNYLIQRLSPTNVCDLIIFTTHIVDATKLRLKCTEYLIKCMKESKAVHGLEKLDKDFRYQTFLTAFAQTLEVQ